ncbi:MAG: TRAP transporter small permease [Desulfobacter sp.]|nr:TRAP transporter small permease [Desulfobacter sp.]WDP84802.1 MAG: TRAP transporter small permease [Desulfobacter sp.]
MKTKISILDRLSLWLQYLGAAALTAMMLLTVADVVGRFFKHPIFGSVELVGFLAVIVMAAALPYTYKMDGHVGVEIVTRLLPKNIRQGLEIITRTLSFILFSVIAWQMFLYAGDIRDTGEVSMNLEFPIHYIVSILAAGLAVFAVIIGQRIIDTMKQKKES